MPIVRDHQSRPQRTPVLSLTELAERAATLEQSAEIADLYLAFGLDIPDQVLNEVTELSAIRYSLVRCMTAGDGAPVATDVIGGVAA